MKTFILLILFIGCSLNFIAQTFEIEEKRYPYVDIIEWKGKGAILISKDPLGNNKQITLTLVSEEKKSVWDQQFTPKGEEYYFISSENARYVYFLDNIELKTGKVYFTQLNSAGNIKATSIHLGSAVRKIAKINYNELKTVNVVVTDKALVHHFRYTDKERKTIREFAVFTTHHNFLSYAVELGETPFKQLKDLRYGFWEYIGFTGDQIFFAARTFKKEKGWGIKAFSSKGKITIPGLFLIAPENLIPVQNIGFGTTGKYYLKSKPTIEYGLLSQINGHFYLVGGQRKQNTGAEITLFQYTEGEWKELNEMHLNYFIEKKPLDMGIYPMNEGIGYHLNHNGYNKVSIIFFDKKRKEAPHNDFTEKTIFNPSSVFLKKEKNEFVVILPNGFLIFDIRQLGKKEKVTFEFKSR